MNDYITPQSFMDLYYDFTGYVHSDFPSDGRVAIGKEVGEMQAQANIDRVSGDLLLATSSDIVVYSGDPGHKLICKAPYRATLNSGFYEVTSISHTGIAIAYLALLKADGRECWQKHLDPMIDHLRQIRADNKVLDKSNHWLYQLDEPAWRGKEEGIRNMIDYATSMAANYLISVKQDNDLLSIDHVVDHFLNLSNDDYPVSYNNVMIGTFSVAALASLYSLYTTISSANLDWSKTEVLLHNLSGMNFSAGLDTHTNWLCAAIKAIAGKDFDTERMLIVPYADIPASVGGDSLPDVDFNYLSQVVWGALYNRPGVSRKAMAHVKDIKRPDVADIPGNFKITGADEIGDFIQRLKFSVSDPKEMLSNTVGFWLSEEALDKDWDIDKIRLPGFTDGFPTGLDAYPSDAPEILNT